MKKKLTNNIGLKILSVILATILWLIITNVDDPEETKRFNNVPVDVLNEDVIASLNQVYDIKEGETINFTVEAKRSTIEKLKRTDFVVTADFSNLSIVNSVPIEISCPRYGDEVAVVDGKYQNMKVSLEDLVDENFKVDVVQKGEPAEGYVVGAKTASPNIIKVTGPKSRVQRIAEVVVEADVTGMSQTDKMYEKPKALDADGNEIDASNLTFSVESVEVNITIFNTKTINLQITTTGEPAYGYAMSDIEYEPKTITIAGDDAALKKINYLSITESIAGAQENIEKEINIQDELEEGVIIVGEDQTAVINITIEKLVTKDISLWPGDIEPRNKPENLQLTYNTPGAIPITVMGLAKDINNLTKQDIHPYIDLTGYTAGTYSLIFGIDKSDPVTLIDSPYISFILTEAAVSD